MRGFVPPDPETSVSEFKFAVVYAPRRSRNRVPAGCVTIVADEATARAEADPAKKNHAARVLGPSKSSEGQYLYYVMEWLE